MNRGSYFSRSGKQKNLTANEEALSRQPSAVSQNIFTAKGAKDLRRTGLTADQRGWARMGRKILPLINTDDADQERDQNSTADDLMSRFPDYPVAVAVNVL